jgi:hypothetical protein
VASLLSFGRGDGCPEQLGEARQILATVAVTPGSVNRTDPRWFRTTTDKAPLKPARGSFVGIWEVHDAMLGITSDKTGVLTAAGNCRCLVTHRLALSLTAGGAQMNAVVTAVRATDRTTGKVVPDPQPNETRGQRSFFEFMEPHLMLQVSVPNEPADAEEPFGNAYWCGRGLATEYHYACGA